ncbi:MAG: CPBP family intramembrane glutamic endopeptidase [Opitutaceae bacterium]
MTETPLPVLVTMSVLLTAGVALWIWTLSRNRQQLPWRGNNQLAHWDIPVADFLLLFFLVVLFVFFGSQAAVYWSDASGLEEPATALRQAVVSGYTFHLGSIVVWILFGIYHPGIWPGRGLSWFNSSVAAIRSLLFAIPVILLVFLPWSALLEALGLSTAPQPLVGIFQEADEPGYLIALAFLAVVVAPINEELLFRGGIFRFLKSRFPTSLAMIVSSVLFALLHLNWFSFLPLFTLGCFLSLVTLKTGSLKPAILMHALFNLNSVLAILASPAS